MSADALDRALRAARRGRPDDARRGLDEVLAAEPDHEEALVWRARVAGSVPERDHFLQRALAVNPGLHWARETLAAGATGGAAAAEAAPRPDTLDLLQCPSCGGNVELHPGRGAQAAVCRYCGSVLDLTSAQLDVLGQTSPRVQPAVDIEPGMEAMLDGAPHLVLGWTRYEGSDDEETWTWDEWQLVGPGNAVRYLSFSSDEGFTLQAPVRPTRAFAFTDGVIPVPDGHARVTERSQARITALRGELTWRPRLSVPIGVMEAVGPGGIHYSAEWTDGEVELAGGRRISAADVWRAFGRTEAAAHAAAAARRTGTRRAIGRMVMLAAAVLGAGGLLAQCAGTPLLEQQLALPVGGLDDAAVAAGTFDVTDLRRPYEASVDVSVSGQDWASVELYITDPAGDEHLVVVGDDLWRDDGEGSTTASRTFFPATRGRHAVAVAVTESSRLPGTTLSATVRVLGGVWATRYLWIAAVALGLVGWGFLAGRRSH